VGPDKTVLIIGTGAIGLASVALARYYGAKKIILCGRKDNKLEIGRAMGADVCINTTAEDMEEAVRREADGKGADSVIETSGFVGLIPQVLRLAAYGGYVGLIGFYERTVPTFEIDEIVMKALSVRGIMGEFGMPGEVLDILSTGKVDLKPMITHIFPFDETDQVMQNAAQYGDTKIKMLAQIAGE